MIIKSLDQLNSLSEKIADHLKEKDCIFLTGEIGVGKTTFTRYLINYFLHLLLYTPPQFLSLRLQESENENDRCGIHLPFEGLFQQY